MKRIITIIAAVLITATVWAQSPEKMSYQAVIRNASNNLVTSTAVGMQISILQGSSSGTAVYVETQTPSTNTNGLVSIEIGSGTVVSGDFATINWANGPYFIRTETDPAGGTSYTITGTSKLLSVPYALHAKTAETITGTITETDPIFGASQAANITATDITNLGNLSGVNTGDQDISGIATNATAISTLEGEQTTQNTAIALNTAKTGITTAQANAIIANTGKDTTGIYHANRTALNAVSGVNTGDQDISGITSNATAITTIQSEQTTQNTAIALNTAKTGITTAQANAIIANTGKDTTGVYHANRTALDAVSGVNTGDQDGSETKVTAGTNVIITGSGTTASPYVVNATGGGTTLSIGDSYQGGIIFWLDATGQHGLIAATADQSTGIQWYNGTYRYTGTASDGLYAGAMNTTMIVATQIADNQTGNFAAKVCADYSVTDGGVTYGDWYLPSKYELNLLYAQKTAVGGFASAYYWSSTEGSSIGGAWHQAFSDGSQRNLSFDKDYTFYVRAVRAF